MGHLNREGVGGQLRKGNARVKQVDFYSDYTADRCLRWS